MSATANRTASHAVDLEEVTHRYGAATAVEDVTLSIRAGEIVALLGPSGCGKTTLLRVIAGFVRQTAGRVLVDGAGIDDLPANRRNVGIVFQNYALFPHMSVAENVAYGLRARGRGRDEVRSTVERFLDVVRLCELRDRLPRQLSGGQQQRVALARALAVEPSILLLDEPFSALDKGLRLDMQIEIKKLQRQFGLTAILVTHDQDEAMSVADRIAVMNKGRVEQFEASVAVYDRPATLFVNGFIGTTNLLGGRVSSCSNGWTTIALDVGAQIAVSTDRSFETGSRAVLSARPEQLALFPDAADDRWPVRVDMVVPLGPTSIYDLEMPGGQRIKLAERRIGAPTVDVGAIYCGLRPEARPALFDVTSEAARE
ncbi:MAG: transporter ATP-binding protein [Microvirga sp.]|jgi:putative spermidine/putrescine transport system ATP-binding protein|nr:transporter ATP-binding protein [Microvirga sp.]